jgi:hypothetical protein
LKCFGQYALQEQITQEKKQLQVPAANRDNNAPAVSEFDSFLELREVVKSLHQALILHDESHKA